MDEVKEKTVSEAVPLRDAKPLYLPLAWVLICECDDEQDELILIPSFNSRGTNNGKAQTEVPEGAVCGS